MKTLTILLLGGILTSLTSIPEQIRTFAQQTTLSPEERRGQAELIEHGCISCHTIPGIRGADGLVGPSLEHIGSRIFIAGVLTNTDQNLKKWIRDPPSIDDKTAMPNLFLSANEVDEISAYLQTLK